MGTKATEPEVEAVATLTVSSAVHLQNTKKMRMVKARTQH